jgi:hypothetical protein
MFFFRIIYPNYGLKADNSPSQEMDSFPSQKESGVPSRKPVCVMHPENTPRMICDNGFPKDFQFYEYAGATLEILQGPGPNGKMVRRPALVAKMIHRAKVEDGAFVEVEMTASLCDLRKGGHPNAEAIAAALKMYYEEKIPAKERPIRTQPAKTAKMEKLVGVAAPVSQAVPANEFFMKMNAPLSQASQAR